MSPENAAAPRGLCVFDLDQTLLDGRAILHLGQRFDLVGEIQAIWAQSRDDELAAGAPESRQLARLFRGVPVSELESACRKMPLRNGATTAVRSLKRMGFRVGVASASYTVATQAISRRLGLDMHAGAELEVAEGRLTGTLSPSVHRGPCSRFICKESVLDAWARSTSAALTVGVGDGANDECLLRRADLAIAIEPAHPKARAAAKHVVSDLRHVPELVARHLAAVGGGAAPDPVAAPSQ